MGCEILVVAVRVPGKARGVSHLEIGVLLHKTHGNARRDHGDPVVDFIILGEEDVVVVGLRDGDHGRHIDPRLRISEAREEKKAEEQNCEDDLFTTETQRLSR
jgi:hypothetical protein